MPHRIVTRRLGGSSLACASACLVTLTLLLSACSETAAPPTSEPAEVGVVVNSVDISLTVFPVDDPAGAGDPVGLGPAGSPVGLSVRGDLAVVPLGVVPAVAVVDLSAGVLATTIGLPENSGASGSAFVADSVVLVANPGLNSVSPVDLRTGGVGEEIAVGGFPHGIAVSGARVVVLNAELGPDFQPAGPGTVTVLDRSTLSVLGTVELSGMNPGAAVAGPDGRVYVVNSGTFGDGDGSISVVDPAALDEVAHHTGFGEFPAGVALDRDGRLYVASFSYGLAVWDTATEEFVRSPEEAVEPGGVPSVSGLGFDGEERLYTLLPDCSAPSAAYRLTPGFEIADVIPVGTCPIAIAFGGIEPE